ncbi:disease resistance protein At4g27190-like [Mangifera indica]|uniref:disease resistance protein At4g27190-like n=1 Tax=Mangifera indica TaxID=29780 RepID=UPI001CFB0B09|nr:disease resistance protein At4g27190-like [Mangifera indica]
MAEEIVTSAAAELASKATESAYDLLKLQISYVFKSQSYINNLKDQVEELRMKKERVEKSAESAERQGEEIHNDVKNWLSAVDDFTEREAKAIIEDGDKANKGSCLKLKSCPNLIQRYKLGKEAVKAAVTGANLLGKGNFSSVSYRPALQRTESMYVRGYEAFDSRVQVFQEIMDTLKDGTVYIIGVYGMGGVGKTTLVKKIAWQVKEDKLFHEVAIAEVTPTPDNKKIQEKIAFDLGLEFRQENEFERAGLLRKRIEKEKNLLVILDNIWTKLDLDTIGIPFEDAKTERKDGKIRPCTILLTSRKRDVLSKDMKTQENILVDTLSYEDTWNLFRKIVGDSAESSEFHPLAVEFVTRCSGLPVAISTIANTLKNESLHVWMDALAQLKRSNPRHIPDMEESVYSTIELSYKFLKDEEAKSLFLLCALYDAGNTMFVDDLLKYSLGWNLFGDVYTLEEGRNRLRRLIDYLKASSLLSDGDDANEVKMHDIIHDVAVSIASTEKCMFNIQNATASKGIFLKEFVQLEKLCGFYNACVDVTLSKAIQAVESVQPEEIEKVVKSIEKSYFRLLKKRQKEHDRTDNISGRMEKAIIPHVIRDVLKTLKTALTLAGLWNKQTESESFSEEDELKMRENFQSGKIMARSTLLRKLESLKNVNHCAFVELILEGLLLDPLAVLLLNSEDVPNCEHRYELNRHLVDEVMKMVEETEAERKTKSEEAQQEDLKM